jgi:hypothetical protein
MKYWICKNRYSCNRTGLWPIRVWFYKWGIAFHGLWIADAHLELDD